MSAKNEVQQTSPKDKKPKSKFTAWRGLFHFLDTLHIKKPLTRLFIFHPPKPSYSFEPHNTLDTKSDPAWEFFPKNALTLKSNPYIRIKAFKLYREKHQKDYMIPLIWLHNQRSTSPNILLYSHGNSSDLGTAYCSAMILSTILNMDVVAYDYTGYGLAPFKPSEKNLYSDIESVLSFIVNFLNYPLDKIILCGFSIGSGPTVEMAARYQSLPFIILFAPLASCLAVVEGEKAPEKTSSHDMFTNLEKMSKLSCDVIFVHGEKDRTIPRSHSTKMFERYIETHKGTKNTAWLLEVDGADHHQLINELIDSSSEYHKSFMQYFDFLVGSNHTTKEEEVFNLLQLIQEEGEKSLQEEVSIDGENLKEENSKEGNQEQDDDQESSEKEDEEEKKDSTPKQKIAIPEKENEKDENKKEDGKQQNGNSAREELLKKETSKLRSIFSKLTVNKPPAKKKTKPKTHEEMVAQAKDLI